jgi:hypothetical protein
VTVDDWIYAGGNFNNIGGQPRNNIARLYGSDGRADPTFNPNANSWVNAIAIDANNNPVVGGQFTTIGGQPRYYIARLNSSNGTADPNFNPNADNWVYAIAIDANNNPVVGGFLTKIDGQPRNYIARWNSSNGTADVTLSTLVTLLSTVLTLFPTQQLTVTATAHQLSASSSTIPQSSTIPARLI